MSALEKVASMKAEHEAKVAQFNELAQEITTDLKIAEDAGFDAGLAQAGVPATDKIYTEADLQAEKQIAADAAKAAAELQASADMVALKQAVAAKIRDASVDDLAIAAELEA